MKKSLITKDTPITYIEKLAAKCDKCAHCCSYGSGYVLDADIPALAKHMGIGVERFKEEFLLEVEPFGTKVHKMKVEKGDKPYGHCTFLDGKDCMIQPVKPLHCKLAKGCGEYGEELSCWFSLNYLVKPENPESIRQWSQFLVHNDTIPGGKLEELVPDKAKLKKILSYETLK